jgi:rfaE bifunctional protein kinase chain/domain
MKEFLNKISGKKLLVIGDLMLDRYIFGDVSRISPEAPVPVVDIDNQKHVAGGAANVALNLRSLGADVEICGWLGMDPDGDILLDLLSKARIDIDPRFQSTTSRTIVKTRVMVRNQQLCRLDQEAPPSEYVFTKKDIEWIVEKSKEKDAIILSDYGKGIMSHEVITALQAARKHAKPIIALDPKPRRHIQYQHLDLITPNRSEALELANITQQPHEPFLAELVCQKIYQTYRPEHLVITLGAEGMLLSQKGKIDFTIPTTAREVFDVSGAGDTVIATLTLMLACGAGIKESAQIANLAAGIVVGKVGTATVTPEELLAGAER